MRKLSILILSLFMLIAFAACETEPTTAISTQEPTLTTSTQSTETTSYFDTTKSTLATPSNIVIDSNIITFDTVENAQKYRLSIYDSESTLVGEYNITSEFDLSLLLSLGSYSCTLKATATNYNDSPLTDIINFAIVDETTIRIIEGTDMNDPNYIRWMGRTYFNNTENLTYFYFTASGFEVAFFGTEIEITVQASKSNITSKQPHLVAFLDGEENPLEGTTYVLNEEQETITFQGLTDGYHTVKVLKRSEASDSNTALKKIETDGYFTMPPQPKPFKIQYIAASSSTGFGNLGSVNDAKTTANSNGLLAYAYLTSYLLDAETSIFSASGWGVTRGWNTGGSISTTQNIPNAFVNIAIDDTNTVFTEGTFDYSAFVPDVIVVNLGTNDFNSSGYTGMSETEKETMEERFVTDYVNFLIVLNNMYPNAKIIIAYGLMNEAGTLGDVTLEVVNTANTQIGSTVVYDFLMEAAGTNGNPYGCAYHPNVQTGMNVAEDLAEFIHQITGREIVREMVTYGE